MFDYNEQTIVKDVLDDIQGTEDPYFAEDYVDPEEGYSSVELFVDEIIKKKLVWYLMME